MCIRDRAGGNQEWSGDPQTHGLRLPRRRPRRTHPTLLQRALQPLSELPSSLCASRGRSRRERPQTLLLPALSNPAGDAAGPAPARAVPARWAHRRRLTTHRRGGQRYRSRPAYAAGQAQTLRAVAACGLRGKMKLAAAKAVEMTVGAKPCGFRPHLGNRCAIPTFPPPRRLLDCFLNSNPERSFPQPSAQASFRLILRLEKTEKARAWSAGRSVFTWASGNLLRGRRWPWRWRAHPARRWEFFGRAVR